VPRLPVADVSFHRAAGRLTVRPRGFACLPEDPASALPGARVVPDTEALRPELRAAVAEHLAPVLDGFRPRMRCGRRAMWGMATDEVTESLWRIGVLLGEEDRAVAELGALLPGSTAPYAGAADFRTLGHRARLTERSPPGTGFRAVSSTLCARRRRARPALVRPKRSASDVPRRPVEDPASHS
jgi:hypothetical protein